MRLDESPTPPSFEQAKTRRQQARAAGLHPDHWYAVEYDSALKAGCVIETHFWGRSIALFRGDDETVRAIENRCLHRQLKLSLGEVKGCNLVCAYHGWTYDGSGKLAAVPHDLFGHKQPAAGLRSFPVKVRYGLIWIFPGDARLADATPLPDIPELEGPDAWVCVPLDFTWQAHHSMIIENVCDFTHAHLHRDYRPINDATLTLLEPGERRVKLSYDVLVGDGQFSRHFVDRNKVKVDKMELCFEYPYQWSNTGDRIKHWCFFLPIDRRITRVFFLFYFDALRIPGTHIPIPKWLMKPVLKAANRMMIRPILMQDGEMVEAEQRAYDSNTSGPAIELNPAVLEFQNLTVRSWQRHLDAPQLQPREARLA